MDHPATGNARLGPEALRPDYIAQTVSSLGHTDCDIAAVLLYAWATAQQNPSNAQDWLGISPPGGGPSSDTEAFTSGLRGAFAPGPPTPVCSAEPVAAASRVSRRPARPHRARRSHRVRMDRSRRHSRKRRTGR